MWLAGLHWVFGRPLDEVFAPREEEEGEADWRDLPREGHDFTTRAEAEELAEGRRRRVDPPLRCPAGRERLVRRLLSEVNWFLWTGQWPGGLPYDSFGWARTWLWGCWFDGRDRAERAVARRRERDDERARREGDALTRGLRGMLRRR